MHFMIHFKKLCAKVDVVYEVIKNDVSLSIYNRGIAMMRSTTQNQFL